MEATKYHSIFIGSKSSYITVTKDLKAINEVLLLEDKKLMVTFVQDVLKVDYIFLMKALHCIEGLHSENKLVSVTANMNRGILVRLVMHLFGGENYKNL